jgi:hypothetical protein
LGFPNTLVGINVGAPSATLDVHQTFIDGLEKGISLVNSNLDRWEIFNSYPLFFKFNGTAKAFIDATDGHYAQLSDARLKHQIEPMQNILPGLNNLEPSRYQLIGDTSGKVHLGLLAQEVKEIFPEVVSLQPGSDLGYPALDSVYMVDYSALAVIAIAAIKEQQDALRKLQIEVELLKEQYRKLIELKPDP